MKTKQERAEIFKLFQENIKRADTFEVGKQYLLNFRTELSLIYSHIFDVCRDNDFHKMPLTKDKTIAYCIYHLIRIEDITSNTLIAGKSQIFFEKNYDNPLGSPIITTGNELTSDDLIKFSASINPNQLKAYAIDVLDNTNTIIDGMSFEDSQTRVSVERKVDLIGTKSVSENTLWLADYWCRKTYAGLLLMPLSRHHMGHLNACLRIINRLKK